MDFNLTKEQALIQKMVREFTETEVKPIAAETDKTCAYPRENIEKLFQYGVMGMCVPKEYAVSYTHLTALNPEHPSNRGNNVNPDVYFQCKEGANVKSAIVPDTVQHYMDEINKIDVYKRQHRDPGRERGEHGGL